jgi:hypothetical protein
MTVNQGRPSTYREKKAQRTISITNTAWENIQAQATALGVSGSEYIEQSARKNDALDIPIYGRIKSILQPNITLFWSLAEFTRRTAVQFGVLEPPELVDSVLSKQQAIIQKEVVTKYVTIALKIVLAMNCAFTELEVRHLTPFLSLLIYRSIERDAKTIDLQPPTVLISIVEREKSIALINKALEQLKTFAPQRYQILKLRFVGGLNWTQIAKFKRFHEDTFWPDPAIRDEIKQSIHQLRRCVHLTHEVSIVEPQNIESDFFHPDALKYYHLCGLSHLSGESSEDMEKMLILACTDPKLNFWLREIDHWAGHQLLDSRDRSRHVDNDLYYADINDAIVAGVSAEMEITTDRKKTAARSMLDKLNIQISRCTTTTEIQAALLTVIEAEAGSRDILVDLPIVTGCQAIKIA